MNIFCTNIDPIVSAVELCDQHCRSKMQVESAQLLQHCFSNETLAFAPRTQKGTVRKSGKGYYNHPSAVWVRQSITNYNWLVDHALAMFDERMYRWPESEEHFTKTFILWCKEHADQIISSKSVGLTDFAIAINDDSNCRKLENFETLSTVEKYQAYIQHDKPFATWTRRNKPSWYK